MGLSLSYDEMEEQHNLSYALVERAMAGELSACVAQQNLLEFIAVVTSAKRVAYPLSVGDALSHVADYLVCFDLPRNTFLTWIIHKFCYQDTKSLRYCPSTQFGV